MVEASTVRKLLDIIELRMGRLFELADIPLEAYVQDYGVQDRVERNFEVCIQACIDLGAHIVADMPRSQPETYADVFRILSDEGILDSELGMHLQRMAGFRNLLAHGYADTVAEKVHHNLGRLGDIQEYVRQVVSYLEAQGVF